MYIQGDGKGAIFHCGVSGVQPEASAYKLEGIHKSNIIMRGNIWWDEGDTG